MRSRPRGKPEDDGVAIVASLKGNKNETEKKGMETTRKQFVMKDSGTKSEK